MRTLLEYKKEEPRAPLQLILFSFRRYPFMPDSATPSIKYF